ncbi:MAG TPA: hypothetical protein VK621_05490, partial [Bradyrhizobium sp.]|nr:hypothetical protein [Bradyrhizobium sp.]
QADVDRIQTVLHDGPGYDIHPSGVDQLLCQSRVQRQRDRLAAHSSSTGFSGNPAMLYDTGMTAASAFPELAHEMHEHPCTGRVLEQETGERLDRFRRRCAVFMD